MPLYDYACSACGQRVEVLHGRDTLGPSSCELCGGPMRKLMSAAAVVFKGSGWAKRDRAVATAPGPEKKAGGEAATTGDGDGARSADGDATAAPAAPSSDTEPGTTGGTAGGTRTGGGRVKPDSGPTGGGRVKPDSGPTGGGSGGRDPARGSKTGGELDGRSRPSARTARGDAD
jgi:putative FmdB family regulatory protein